MYCSKRQRLNRKFSFDSRNGDLSCARFRRRSGGLAKRTANNKGRAYTRSFIEGDLRLLFTVSLPKQVLTYVETNTWLPSTSAHLVYCVA